MLKNALTDVSQGDGRVAESRTKEPGESHQPLREVSVPEIPCTREVGTSLARRLRIPAEHWQRS